MKRLLCIVGGLNQGGAETFLMKMLRTFDKTEYMMDFCVMSNEKGKYEDEIKALGGIIYHVVPKSKNPVKCFCNIKNIVKKHGYKSVIRVNEHSLSVIDLIAAKCGGAKKLIMRSSNADSGSKKQRILHKLFNSLPRTIPNVKIAPSTKAAVYTFGKKNVEKGKVAFLKNGLAIDEFTFNEEVRNKLRRELNLEGKFVIGHAGRFSAQKNHDFLIEIFYEISQNNENAVLLLVGTGEKQQEIIQKVKTLGIEEKVLFLGTRTDVPELLSAMDILLFPSFFEGMPNVVIEAQAAGLPCVISDSITREAAITELVKYISLEKNATEWAGAALSHSSKFVRRSYKQEFYNAGYTIESVVKNFIDLVF